MRIKFSKSTSPLRRQLCRLCASYGLHRRDILGNAPVSSTELSEKIYRCLRIRVTRNDRMTKKICETCFDNINEFDRFRAVCTVPTILTELSTEAEKTTADIVVKADAGTHKQSNNVNSPVSDEEQSPAKSMTNCRKTTHHTIAPNATENIQRMTLLREPRQAAKHHSQVRPYPVISGVIVSDRTKTSGIRLTFTTITQKGKELRNQSANSVALEQQHSTKGQQQYLRSSPNDAPTAKKYVYTRKMV